ncbi:hypothetical protein BD626DRAFT_634471 [Schizophyllum amplum]|uniref:Uncharacterized protein n=1 Tax=Schizophyllum amplum TaxID=97359 RepID=A0A550BZM7_9AGAR|nr:hypothetical protein BD626DRAFT_634471 [Auriculariopsis ampla]
MTLPSKMSYGNPLISALRPTQAIVSILCEHVLAMIRSMSQSLRDTDKAKPAISLRPAVESGVSALIEYVERIALLLETFREIFGAVSTAVTTKDVALDTHLHNISGEYDVFSRRVESARLCSAATLKALDLYEHAVMKALAYDPITHFLVFYIFSPIVYHWNMAKYVSECEHALRVIPSQMNTIRYLIREDQRSIRELESALNEMRDRFKVSGLEHVRGLPDDARSQVASVITRAAGKLWGDGQTLRLHMQLAAEDREFRCWGSA